MSRYWHKGCLCGCLVEEECRYVDRTPAPQVVHHVHHHFVHTEPVVEHVDAEVTIVREIEEA